MMKIPRVTLQKILEAHPISKEALLSIESKFKTIRFAKGDIITKEGEIQNKIFFIRSGMLRGYYLFSNHEITSWLAIEMEPVTSLSSFFDQSPSREFIQAVEDSVLDYLTYEDLNDLSNKYTSIRELYIKMLEINISKTELRVLYSKLRSAKDKLLFLQNYYEDSYLKRIPKNMLASLIGVRKESLSRLLKN
ncbi:Crp/Fnr family transcriptional regulator [Flavobacteriaceae bacterium LSUCC0859]|nr:Crp/Fnr family transcriptional regulator [Flavobacteriaceae bacterium LSUCC0859]